MAKTVLGVFDSVDQAERAADELQRKAFKRDEISIVAKESSAKGGDRERGRDKDQTLTQGVTTGGTLTQGVSTGGAIGGAAGLLAGVGALAVPGIGPIVAAGPIAAALTGAVTGGVAGGLIDWGIPEETGRRYEEKVREGKVVTAVRTDDNKVKDAADILRRNGASDVETH
jgi:outer membrane lipoprotein SlyB